MKAHLKLQDYVKPTPMPETFYGDISGFDETSKLWKIDCHFFAHVAVSLLVTPEVGDKVAFIFLDETGYIINQILARNIQNTSMTLQTDREVNWLAPRISIQAQDELELVALNTVSMMGNNLVHSAQTSLVQQAETMIMQANQLSATADGVMNLTGKQQMLIAEEDVRIDGNRINMG